MTLYNLCSGEGSVSHWPFSRSSSQAKHIHFVPNEHFPSQHSVSRKGKAAMCGFAVVSIPPREVGFSLWFAWTARRTLYRAVWGDPAKPPPSSWLSRLQAACKLISSSPSANQSTDITSPPFKACLWHSLLGRPPALYAKHCVHGLSPSHSTFLSLVMKSAFLSHGSPRSAPNLRSNLLNLISCLYLDQLH